MPYLYILVGPPGSGKSTYAQKHDLDHVYISQDVQGKSEHLAIFNKALSDGKDIIVDRMNFNKEQRIRYLEPAKALNYETKIIVLHQSYDICLQRCLLREGHPTITDERGARSALKTFFTKYERPTKDEADVISFKYPEGDKPLAIWSDLDGTLCNVDHRLHYVRGEGKKNWGNFFRELVKDSVNEPVFQLLRQMNNGQHIVYCSGRPDAYKKETEAWLKANRIPEGRLFMRSRDDFRRDDVVKEILLDFEVLTRYEVLFCLDDRDQVVNMLRSRGQTVFQVAKGDF